MPTVTFLGHSAAEIVTDGTTILIDPFLTGNPVAARTADEMSADYILLTHGHSDHIGDTFAIAQRCNSTVIAPYELAVYCQQHGVNVHPMHIGGAHEFPFGRVKLTPAWHGSAVIEDGQIIYLGNPCGLLVTAGGKTLYHSGDTALFGDMKLIGERNAIDIALLPIGDNFTMGVEDAVEAAKLLGAAQVVPIHYNTFELLNQDVNRFVHGLDGVAEVVVLQPGESVDY